MLKKVRIFLRTERYGVAAQLFEDVATGMSEADVFVNSMLEPQDDDEGPQSMEMYSDARLRLTDDMFSLSYEESELTGMEGSSSQLSFMRSQPELVTMLRSGSVSTALVFEPNKRHFCTYKTPFMPFEVCVHTLRIDNKLLGDAATLDLDYIVEIRGAQAERCRLHLEIKE
ncbi:MAG: DUF1934 domain-containing protein [Clostridia bacterium]|nr:DUF1934 domain-containing protein [Clostridia bacterium]